MGGAAKTSPGQAASSIPLPTTMTWAGSCPDPEPWMIETLSSRGASARMMRLYSGTYLSLPGLASSTPLSISGTNCWGSLTNFFTTSPLVVCAAARARSGPFQFRLLPGPAYGLEHHRDADGARINRVATPLARVGRAPALGEHALRRLRRLAGSGGRARQRVWRALSECRLELVDRGYERVQQRLVPEVAVPALLDAFDGRSQRRDHVRAGWVRGRRQRAAGTQEGGPPDRARGPADALAEHDRGLLEQAAGVLVAELVPVSEDDLEAARERVAEVPVTDNGVQLAEVGLVVDGGLGDGPDDQLGPAQRRVAHTASSWGRG